MKGTVLWFDNDKGEGEVFYLDTSFYFHYSAIESNDIWKKLEKNDIVEFRLYENLYMRQVEWIKKI